MVIQTDEEGKKAVIQLCDIALRQGGVQVMQGVTTVLGSIKVLPFEPEAEPETPDEEQTD